MCKLFTQNIVHRISYQDEQQGKYLRYNNEQYDVANPILVCCKTWLKKKKVEIKAADMFSCSHSMSTFVFLSVS